MSRRRWRWGNVFAPRRGRQACGHITCGCFPHRHRRQRCAIAVLRGRHHTCGIRGLCTLQLVSTGFSSVGQDVELTWLEGLQTQTVVGVELPSQVVPHVSAVAALEMGNLDGTGFGNASKFCARARPSALVMVGLHVLQCLGEPERTNTEPWARRRTYLHNMPFARCRRRRRAAEHRCQRDSRASHRHHPRCRGRRRRA